MHSTEDKNSLTYAIYTRATNPRSSAFIRGFCFSQNDLTIVPGYVFCVFMGVAPAFAKRQ
jgi:hypothetical protein